MTELPMYHYRVSDWLDVPVQTTDSDRDRDRDPVPADD
jgi:hypothetical protein